MRSRTGFIIGCVVLMAGAGCRAATGVREFPRVDLELPGGGNRGYLVGAPPEGAQRKTTREMIETVIEVPGLPRSKRGQQAAAPEMMPGEAAPTPEELTTPEAAPVRVGAGAAYDTYVVQKGENLWTIAAKPEVYGRATAWRRIFDANRELLKSPDHVRAGMTLKIPRGDSSDETSDVTYRK